MPKYDCRASAFCAANVPVVSATLKAFARHKAEAPYVTVLLSDAQGSLIHMIIMYDNSTMSSLLPLSSFTLIPVHWCSVLLCIEHCCLGLKGSSMSHNLPLTFCLIAIIQTRVDSLMQNTAFRNNMGGTYEIQGCQNGGAHPRGVVLDLDHDAVQERAVRRPQLWGRHCEHHLLSNRPDLGPERKDPWLSNMCSKSVIERL